MCVCVCVYTFSFISYVDIYTNCLYDLYWILNLIFMCMTIVDTIVVAST